MIPQSRLARQRDMKLIDNGTSSVQHRHMPIQLQPTAQPNIRIVSTYLLQIDYVFT